MEKHDYLYDKTRLCSIVSQPIKVVVVVVLVVVVLVVVVVFVLVVGGGGGVKSFSCQTRLLLC